MKSEKELKKDLENLEGAIELQEKGFVTLSSTQHKHIVRRIDLLKEILEIER